MDNRFADFEKNLFSFIGSDKPKAEYYYGASTSGRITFNLKNFVSSDYEIGDYCILHVSAFCSYNGAYRVTQVYNAVFFQNNDTELGDALYLVSCKETGEFDVIKRQTVARTFSCTGTYIIRRVA